MTAFVSALDSALLNFVWQGVLAAMLLWLTLAVVRPRSANARYISACAALGLLALLPVATAWHAWQGPIGVRHSGAVVLPPVILSGVPAEFDWSALAQSWIIPAWACGVMLFSIRLLGGCASISRLTRRGAPADQAVIETIARLCIRLRVSRPVRPIILNAAEGPSVAGWLRPVILIPAATLMGLPADQMEAVLAHELAHIRRYDYLVNLAQMVIETLFFYHPAVWWISKRIREERELCCDDIAVDACGDAIGYAHALATLARMRTATRALALGAKDGPLLYRIERLLGVARSQPAPSRVPAILAICLGLACLMPGVKPAKAQAQVPAAPSPQPPQPDARPGAAARTGAAPRAGATAQPLVPAPAPALSTADDVVVEVTVNRNGEVSDARVISGPIEDRRAALLTVLNRRFPQDGTPFTRYVNVPPSVSTFSKYVAGIQPLPDVDQVQADIARMRAHIAALRAQQVEASMKGAAQLDEAIEATSTQVDKLNRFVEGENPLAGKPLEDINITGVSDDLRGTLLAQLPVGLHHALTKDSMAEAIRVVKQTYPNAEAFFGTIFNGDAALFIGIRR